MDRFLESFPGNVDAVARGSWVFNATEHLSIQYIMIPAGKEINDTVKSELKDVCDRMEACTCMCGSNTTLTGQICECLVKVKDGGPVTNRHVFIVYVKAGDGEGKRILAISISHIKCDPRLKWVWWTGQVPYADLK